TVRVSKALTLQGSGVAELRGSDIWTDWVASSTGWLSNMRIPALPGSGQCRPGINTCLQPEQVFVDGVGQVHASSAPRIGQFGITQDRRIILGSDPAGHTVEVSTRARWLDVTASNVTV